MSETQKIFLNVVSIAQTILHGEKDKSKITPALIAEKVKIAAGILALPSDESIDQELDWILIVIPACF